jgi:hypothetical protein
MLKLELKWLISTESKKSTREYQSSIFKYTLTITQQA